MTKVSVIIPNYNRATIIGDTIENMLAQSLKPIEVIVVDDGSTDNSISLLKSFGEKIKLIQQPNSGPGVARNAGLRIARGEFIQLMDSDDLASLNKFEVQARLLENSKADIAYGPWTKVYFSGRNVSLVDVVLQQKKLPASKTPLYYFLSNWSTLLQTCLVRKSLLDAIGGYRHDMWGFEDSEIITRILVRGVTMAYENKSLTLYRQDDHGKLTSSGQVSSKRAMNQADFYIAIINNQSIPFSLINGFSFQLKLWQTLYDLKITNQTQTDQYRLLKQKFHYSPLKMRSFTLLQQKISGIKSRIVGHRWTYPYQVGTLTSYQKSLIEQMGYRLEH